MYVLHKQQQKQPYNLEPESQKAEVKCLKKSGIYQVLSTDTYTLSLNWLPMLYNDFESQASAILHETQLKPPFTWTVTEHVCWGIALSHSLISNPVQGYYMMIIFIPLENLSFVYSPVEKGLFKTNTEAIPSKHSY